MANTPTHLRALLHTDNMRWRRMPEDPHGPVVQMSEREALVSPTHNGFTYETAYRTELRVSTTWYANEAQLQGRRELAERELIEVIYGPVCARLNAIRARAYDRDYPAILRLVDELQEELGV